MRWYRVIYLYVDRQLTLLPRGADPKPVGSWVLMTQWELAGVNGLGYTPARSGTQLCLLYQ